jgi:hypothetical protein
MNRLATRKPNGQVAGIRRGVPESYGDRLKPTRRLPDRGPGISPPEAWLAIPDNLLGNPAEFYATGPLLLSGVIGQRKMKKRIGMTFWLKLHQVRRGSTEPR